MAVIRGHVVDPRGQPVVAAPVVVVSSPASMPDIAPLTDEQGRFTIAAPVPGRYTLGVRSERWGTAQADVEVAGQGPVAVEIQFTAKEDGR